MTTTEFMKLPPAKFIEMTPAEMIERFGDREALVSKWAGELTTFGIEARAKGYNKRQIRRAIETTLANVRRDLCDSPLFPRGFGERVVAEIKSRYKENQ